MSKLPEHTHEFQCWWILASTISLANAFLFELSFFHDSQCNWDFILIPNSLIAVDGPLALASCIDCYRFRWRRWRVYIFFCKLIWDYHLFYGDDHFFIVYYFFGFCVFMDLTNRWIPSTAFLASSSWFSSALLHHGLGHQHLAAS